MGALLRCERALWARGVEWVAGVDEAGVGPLAGPVVAAAVVLPRSFREPGIDDSKRLSPTRRERLAARIRSEACGVGIGVVEVEVIDRINIYRASLLAMRRAVQALPFRPEWVLVDGRAIPDLDIPQQRIVRGDQRSYSIAAASIVAKVTRDAWMRALHEQYPQYGFARHMGYATPEHLRALELHGPCPAHRRSFAPVSAPWLPGLGSPHR